MEGSLLFLSVLMSGVDSLTVDSTDIDFVPIHVPQVQVGFPVVYIKVYYVRVPQVKALPDSFIGAYPLPINRLLPYIIHI